MLTLIDNLSSITSWDDGNTMGDTHSPYFEVIEDGTDIFTKPPTIHKHLHILNIAGIRRA
jgi:hypothetical protein